MPSSVIKGMRYAPERRLLEIVFRGDRGMYRYFEVPVAEWAAFCAAASKGTYLNEVFKAKGYRYELRTNAPRRRGSDDQKGDKTLYWGEAGAFEEPMQG